MTDKATSGKGKQKRLVWTLQTVKDRCVEEGECWIWQLGLSSGGYPQARIDGRARIVRKWVYDVLLNKRRPVDSVVRCSCENKLCLSPAHLVHGTQADAVRDSYTSGARCPVEMTAKRRANIVKQGLTKLDMAKAQEIRSKASTQSKTQLAQDYGVSLSTVKSVVSGRYWGSPLAKSAFEWRG